ncbi:MAG: hypothetical protein F4X08_12155 [Gemmatimonadetes bacterium]|nr:hypothetical protein [Gemmatimonadota bacterium]MYI99803.1 hypothetical protein [Gemmatimonadota bacterium]
MTRWTAVLILAAVMTGGNAQAQSGVHAGILIKDDPDELYVEFDLKSKGGSCRADFEKIVEAEFARLRLKRAEELNINELFLRVGIGTVDLTGESGLTACLYSVDIGFGETLYIRENPVTVRYASAPGFRSDFRFGLAWHPGAQTRIENDVRELLRKALAAYMDANFTF